MNWFSTQWLGLVSALALVACLVVGFYKTYQHGLQTGKNLERIASLEYQQKSMNGYLSGLNDVINDYYQASEKIDALAKNYYSQSQSQQQKLNQIGAELDAHFKNSLANCQLDGDGVRLINQLINTANDTAPAAKP